MAVHTKYWERDEVYSLILKYKHHPELWDSKHEGYRNRNKKNTALRLIADVFNTSIGEVSRKLRNLRSNFAIEANKLIKRSRDGKAREVRWEYFKPLLFLLCAHDGSSEQKIKTIETLFDEMTEESDNNDVMLKIEEQINIDSTSALSREDEVDMNEEDYAMEAAVDTPLDQRNDEFKTFGEHITIELRNMHYERNKRKLKRMIQQRIISVTEKDDREYFGTMDS